MAKLIVLALACWLATPAPTGRADDGPTARLRDKVEALVAPMGEGATVAVAFRDLESGEECLIRGDLPFHPASTIKVPVMLEIHRRAAIGQLGLDDRVRVRNEFASIADGSPFALDPADDSEPTLYKRLGEDVPIRELVRLMIAESSNLATNLLVERASPASTTEFMKALGAGDIKVLRGVEDGKAYARGMNNVASARGLMTILVRLAERSAVSPAASGEMLGVLRAQRSREGIPAGLPPGVPVAHKTGSIKGVYHDAAVVEVPGRRPFVLVVLTRGIVDEPAAHRLVAEIARASHEQATRK